jgi:hypothetical protein
MTLLWLLVTAILVVASATSSGMKGTSFSAFAQVVIFPSSINLVDTLKKVEPNAIRSASSLTFSTVLSEVQLTQLFTNDDGHCAIGVDYNGQVYYSTNSGYGWINPKFHEGYATAVAVSGNCQVFYAAGPMTLFRGQLTSNNLIDWELVSRNDALLQNMGSPVTSIKTDYIGKAVLISGYFYNLVSYNTIFSSDALTTRFSVVIGNKQCQSIALDHSGTNIVCTTYSNSDVNILVSTNAGANFTAKAIYSTPYDSRGLATSIYNGNQIIYILPYVYTSTQPLLYVSENNGGSFFEYTGTNSAIQSISATGNGGSVYAASYYGLYCITNNATVWDLCYSSQTLNQVAVSGDGAVIYASTYSEVLVHSNNTFAPIVAPTLMPTKAPTTVKPTLAPVVPQPLTTGWLYLDYYINNGTKGDCSTASTRFAGVPPDYVDAVRLGVCMGNISYAPSQKRYVASNWFTFSCSSVVYEVNIFDNKFCSGTPTQVQQYPIATSFSRYDDDATGIYNFDSDTIYACGQAACSADATLPLPPFQAYYADQEFDSYYSNDDTEDACVNSETLYATINNKCLATSDSSSKLVDFPTTYTYTNAFCQGDPSSYFTLNPGCYGAYTSPLVASTDVDAVTIAPVKEHFTQALARGHFPTAAELVATMKARDQQAMQNSKLQKESKKGAKKRQQHQSGDVEAASLYTDDFHGLMYDDDLIHFDNPKAYSYTLVTTNTPSPTRAPLPTVPTLPPTAPPTINGGWVYFNQYTTDATCKGSPDFVYGYRLGACLLNSTNTWVSAVSCTTGSSSITVKQQFYDNPKCTGTVISTETMTASRVGTGDDDYQLGACVESFCTTQSALPLPVSTAYVVRQQYEEYSGDMCYNSVYFQSILNKKCIQTGLNEWSNISYPLWATYNLPNCQGNPYIENVAESCVAYPSSNVGPSSVTL